MAEYLDVHNSLVICKGFVFWKPSCSFLLNGDRNLAFSVPNNLPILRLQKKAPLITYSSERILCGAFCIPFWGPGAKLYNGSLWIHSISGKYYWQEGAVPFITYLDYNEKILKFTTPLPESHSRIKHCSVAINESTILVFGGYRLEKEGSSRGFTK